MLRRGRPRDTIGDLGEFGFLSRLLPQLTPGRDVLVGVGQDCAVVRERGAKFLITVDALVEGVHFEPGWMSPRQLGRRCFLVNASDIAAMGGQPRWCAVSVSAPATSRSADLEQIHRGIDAAAVELGASIVGGNLTAGRQLAISLTLIAQAPKRTVTREGARPGDRIFVTGTPGDAAVGLRLLRRGHAGGHAIGRFREPPPRLRAGRALVESGIVSAMIDVSDGLLQDLGHICRESGVGAIVEAGRVPLSRAYRRYCGDDVFLALAGGEDYELLCSIPERKLASLRRLRSRLGCPLTEIGRIVRGGAPQVVDRDGRAVDLGGAGYDHFL
jgi:thiamine-monophosphate kinase